MKYLIKGKRLISIDSQANMIRVPVIRLNKYAFHINFYTIKNICQSYISVIVFANAMVTKCYITLQLLFDLLLLLCIILVISV